MSWTVEPYVGAGPLKFGMSPAEVADILGAPKELYDRSNIKLADPDYAKNDRESVTEFREEIPKELPIITYNAGKVTLIDFTKAAKRLSLDGISLFGEKRKIVIEKLIEKSDNVFEDFEGYFFLDHGIMMSNVENFRSQPNIGVFKKGHFDALMKKNTANRLGDFARGTFV